MNALRIGAVGQTISIFDSNKTTTYTPHDFSVSLGLIKEEKFTPALTYGDKK